MQNRRRAAARSGEWAQHFSNDSCYLSNVFNVLYFRFERAWNNYNGSGSAALKFFWTCVALKLVDDDDDDGSVQLVAESEQVRRTLDNSGPRDELDFWKRRVSRFNFLVEQIKHPHVKAALNVLSVAKSKLLKVGELNMTAFTEHSCSL